MNVSMLCLKCFIKSTFEPKTRVHRGWLKINEVKFDYDLAVTNPKKPRYNLTFQKDRKSIKLKKDELQWFCHIIEHFLGDALSHATQIGLGPQSNIFKNGVITNGHFVATSPTMELLSRPKFGCNLATK